LALSPYTEAGGACLSPKTRQEPAERLPYCDADKARPKPTPKAAGHGDPALVRLQAYEVREVEVLPKACALRPCNRL